MSLRARGSVRVPGRRENSWLRYLSLRVNGIPPFLPRFFLAFLLFRRYRCREATGNRRSRWINAASRRDALGERVFRGVVEKRKPLKRAFVLHTTRCAIEMSEKQLCGDSVGMDVQMNVFLHSFPSIENSSIAATVTIPRQRECSLRILERFRRTRGEE